MAEPDLEMEVSPATGRTVGAGVEHAVDPDGEDDGQGQVDLEDIAVEKALAVEEGDVVDEVGHRGEAAPGEKEADHRRCVPDPPLTGLGGSGGGGGQEADQGHDREDADVARDLGQVEGADETEGEGVAGAQEQGVEAEDGQGLVHGAGGEIAVAVHGPLGLGLEGRPREELGGGEEETEDDSGRRADQDR